MSEKPEALRLAEELYAFHAAKKEMPSVGGQMLGLERYRIVASCEVFSQIPDAANKLIRQHAEIERLKADNERLRRDSQCYKRLKKDVEIYDGYITFGDIRLPAPVPDRSPFDEIDEAILASMTPEPEPATEPAIGARKVQS